MRIKITAYLPEDMVKDYADDSESTGLSQDGYDDLLKMEVDELYDLRVTKED